MYMYLQLSKTNLKGLGKKLWIKHVTVNRPIRFNYRSSMPGKLEYRYRCRFIIYVLFQTAFNCLKMIFENMLFAFRTCNGLNINNGMKKKTQKANEVYVTSQQLAHLAIRLTN